MKAARISEGPRGNDKIAPVICPSSVGTRVLCNDLDKMQQGLSDLYFTLVLAEIADCFLLRRRENALQSSSWDPGQTCASFF